MSDDMKSLHFYGIRGSASKEDAPNVTICFDFKPVDQDPILLAY